MGRLKRLDAQCCLTHPSASDSSRTAAGSFFKSADALAITRKSGIFLIRCAHGAIKTCSASTFIKKQLAAALIPEGLQLLIPATEWGTDKALMIALAGYFHALNEEFIDPATLRATGNLPLGG